LRDKDNVACKKRSEKRAPGTGKTPLKHVFGVIKPFLDRFFEILLKSAQLQNWRIGVVF
jgi:hypothetical protein